MAININKSSTDIKYYYAENGTTLGPFSLSQLLGKIEGETLVYREGIDWTNANKIEELKEFFAQEKLDTISNTNSTNSEFKSTTPNVSNYNTIVSPKKMFAATFSFDGRIRRTEYGLSLIIYFLVYAIVIGLSEESSAFGLAFIPMLWFLWAQGAKRCHDRGNSGWYQIIPFYAFWMLFAEGDSGDNDYGNSPK